MNIMLDKGKFFIIIHVAKQWFSIGIHLEYRSFDKMLRIFISPIDRVYYMGLE